MPSMPRNGRAVTGFRLFPMPSEINEEKNAGDKRKGTGALGELGEPGASGHCTVTEHAQNEAGLHL